MPRISGLELIRSLKICPKIILTTAYREYAAEAFELDVIDYLVKPVTRERFMRSISRFNFYNNALTEKPDVPNNFEMAYIFLKVGKGQLKIYLKDILYIEGLRDYIRIFTTTKTIVTKHLLTSLEEMLPPKEFVRTHKSFIVAINKIESFNADAIEIGKKEIPIGRSYKFAVNKILSSSAAS